MVGGPCFTMWDATALKRLVVLVTGKLNELGVVRRCGARCGILSLLFVGSPERRIMYRCLWSRVHYWATGRSSLEVIPSVGIVLGLTNNGVLRLGM